MINILCTSKPGDGLLCYSYEHCHYLNKIGIESQLVIISHPKFSTDDYEDSIKEKYGSRDVHMVFNGDVHYTIEPNDVTLIMGRSMLTLPYLDRHRYQEVQLLALHKLFSGKLISVYSENHPKDYDVALDYFKPKTVMDLCDFDVYPNGVGIQYEKMINFDVYKPIKNDIQYQYLFLGTNEIYYKEIEKYIECYPDHGIVTYNKKWINPKLNNLFAPIDNILGKFETYVYTKPNFDPAPRLFVEFKWIGKDVIYLRDKNIKDGGMVYWNRPNFTTQLYEININTLIGLIERIELYADEKIINS